MRRVAGRALLQLVFQLINHVSSAGSRTQVFSPAILHLNMALSMLCYVTLPGTVQYYRGLDTTRQAYSVTFYSAKPLARLLEIHAGG